MEVAIDINYAGLKPCPTDLDCPPPEADGTKGKWDLERGRILIVDSDNKSAKELFALFVDEEYDIEMSGCFSDAVDMVKNIRFDCVIMDVNLPDMKGYEAAHIMKTIDPQIQLIMTTDQNTMELETKVRQQDIFYYYIKSFDPQELKLAVLGAFERAERLKKMPNRRGI